jgi:hypothetical protein
MRERVGGKGYTGKGRRESVRGKKWVGNSRREWAGEKVHRLEKYKMK